MPRRRDRINGQSRLFIARRAILVGLRLSRSPQFLCFLGIRRGEYK